MKYFHALAAVVAALLSATCRAETTYCVDDDTALFAAFTSAVLTRAEADIRLQRKATPYVLTSLPSSSDYNMFANLRLRGGFAPGDCDPALRNINADNTKLIYDPAQTGPMRLGTDTSITIEGITLTTLRGLLLKGIGAGTIEVSSTKLGNSSALGQHVLEVRGGPLAPLDIRIVNSLVAGNTVFGGHGAIGIYGNGVSNASLINNTIADNSGGVEFIGLGAVGFYNNVIWDNVGFGLKDMSQATKTPVTLINNVLQASNTLPLIEEQSGTMQDNPDFADAAVGNYRLDGLTSIAVDAGTVDVPGGVPLVDLEGSPRVVGGIVDLGAYETGVDDALNIVVNTTEDTSTPGSGKMSLRRALELAQQNPGVPTSISFNVGGELLPDCPAVFELGTMLPDVSTHVEINGFGQAGAIPNTSETAFSGLICVELKGNGTFHALRASGAGSSLSVKGLRFANFTSAIVLLSGSGHIVAGNAFGSQSAGNARGVVSEVSAKGVHIGGYDLASRNHFIGSTAAAVSVKSHNGFVQGNLIGPAEDGQSLPSIPNSTGISISGNGNEISKNIIAGNSVDGILNQGNGTVVFSNTVGVVAIPGCDGGAECYSALPNARGLVASQFFGLQGSGSQMVAFGNRIASNLDAGVAIADNTARNRIYANRVHGNGGQGIDLGADQQVESLNVDALEPPSSANAGQNFPSIDEAVIGPDIGKATITGELSGKKGTYYVGLFATKSCDGTGQGEGEEPIGSTTVVLGDPPSQSENALAEFSVEVESSASLAGKYATSLANDSLGNSSEFSPCVFFTGVELPASIFQDGFE